MNDALRNVRSRLDALTGAAKTPGIQYVAVGADGPLLEFAHGLADLQREIPVTPETTWMAYSMSKTVTAIAVLQCVESGRIGLDDPVNAHVDGLPYGDRVTVRHLLAHTSGVPNPIPLKWVHPATAHAAFEEATALARVLAASPRLAFPPGTKYRYSNIGYWLLGKVVERATGESFTAHVGARVIRPLGLDPAALGYAVVDADRHAVGYLEKYSAFNLVKGFLIDRELIGAYSGRWLEIRSHYLNGPAFGGLVGTASAFGRLLWDQLQPRSVLLGDEGRRLLYERQTASGAPIAMTLGWHVATVDGSRCYFKEGGGGGFHSMMRLYPEWGLGSVAIANATGFNVRGLLDEVDPLVARG